MGYGMYDPDTSFKPEFSPRELTVVARVLRLSNDERAAVDTLYDGYKAALAARADEIRRIVNDAIERAEIMQDPKLLQSTYSKMSEWKASADKTKTAFLADLRSLLSGDQETRWPLVERELRRSRSIGGGRLFGESIDLLQLLDEVAPNAFNNVEIAELVESYAVELDRTLVARSEFLEANSPTFGELASRDVDQAERVWNEGLRKRQAVRDINERFARLLAEKLEQSQGEKLESLFFEKAYARLIIPTRGDTYLAKARELESLDASQQSKLDDIYARHESERKRLLKQAAALERQVEETWLPPSIAKARGKADKDQDGFDGYQRLPADHPLLPIRQARFELDQRTRGEINAVLSVTQRQSIPADPKASMAYFANYQPMGL